VVRILPGFGLGRRRRLRGYLVRGTLGWEYKRKGKYKDMQQAYGQFCRYREALENPPLLIIELRRDATAAARVGSGAGRVRQAPRISESGGNAPD
jgi:hypothetical protein